MDDNPFIEPVAPLAPVADGSGFFECPTCAKVFTSKQGMTMHRTRSHGYRNPNRKRKGKKAPPARDAQASKPPFPTGILVGGTRQDFLTHLRLFLDEMANEIADLDPGSEEWTRLVTAYFLLRTELV